MGPGNKQRPMVRTFVKGIACRRMAYCSIMYGIVQPSIFELRTALRRLLVEIDGPESWHGKGGKNNVGA